MPFWRAVVAELCERNLPNSSRFLQKVSRWYHTVPKKRMQPMVKFPLDVNYIVMNSVKQVVHQDSQLCRGKTRLLLRGCQICSSPMVATEFKEVGWVMFNDQQLMGPFNDCILCQRIPHRLRKSRAGNIS